MSNIDYLISKLSENKSFKLSLKDNALGVINTSEIIEKQKRNAKDFYGKDYYSQFANYIVGHKDEIQTAFNQAYFNGINCKNFQKNINEIFQKAERKDKIDFFVNCTSKWMEHLPNDSKSRPISHMMLPGTHDSVASKIDWGVIPSFMTKTWHKILFGILKLPVIRHIINRWTITQKDDIETQLKKGTRLLDLRIGKSTNGELYLGHTFLSEKFEESLAKIEKFLNENKKEVLVINLSVDYPHRKHFKQKDLDDIASKINSHLGNKLIPEKLDPNTTSLDDLSKNKGNNQVLFYMNTHKIGQIILDGIRINKSTEIWPDKTSAKGVMKAIAHNMKQPIHEGKEYRYASFNTTPNAKTIIKGVITGDNVVKQGRKVQKNVEHFFQENDSTINDHQNKKSTSGVMFDSPKKKTVQTVVTRNTESNWGKKVKNEKEKQQTSNVQKQ